MTNSTGMFFRCFSERQPNVTRFGKRSRMGAKEGKARLRLDALHELCIIGIQECILNAENSVESPMSPDAEIDSVWGPQTGEGDYDLVRFVTEFKRIILQLQVAMSLKYNQWTTMTKPMKITHGRSFHSVTGVMTSTTECVVSFFIVYLFVSVLKWEIVIQQIGVKL